MSAPNAECVLFQTGDFTLASGAKSAWKIECDALTDADWDGLAAMLVEFLPGPFGRVDGVPRGGVPLAKALRRYADESCYTSLIVDDVWTTGESMERYISGSLSAWAGPDAVMRAVVFARRPAPRHVTALFTMPAQNDGSGDTTTEGAR